jgi:tyrosyl-tRNA synthetase
LARSITKDFHGEDAAAGAEENWAKMFQQHATADDLEEISISFAEVAGLEPNQV